MPMGLRVLRKVEAVVREEMNRAGAIELLMPVSPAGRLVERIRPLGFLRRRVAAHHRPPRQHLLLQLPPAKS